MKNFVVAAMLTLATPAFAGPFGLEKGMTVAQLKAKMPLVKQKGMVYRTTSVPQGGEGWDYFFLIVTPKHGLCKIAAVMEVSSSRYGTELVSKFGTIESLLMRKYGAGNRVAFLMPNSIWNEPGDWMMSLVKKDRGLAHFWPTELDSDSSRQVTSEIQSIVLEALANTSSRGSVMLTYELTNWDAFSTERDAAAASSL